MRMMLKCSLDVAVSNQAILNGTLPNVIEKLMSITKPESAYFTADGGTRTIYLFFDMKDSSEMPPIGELMWINLGGKVEVQPVMNKEELQKGLTEFMKGA